LDIFIGDFLHAQQALIPIIAITKKIITFKFQLNEVLEFSDLIHRLRDLVVLAYHFGQFSASQHLRRILFGVPGSLEIHSSFELARHNL